MTNVPQIIRQRRKRESSRSSRQQKRSARFSLGCLTVFSSLLAMIAIVTTIGYTQIARDLPSLEEIPILLDPGEGTLLQPTIIFDRDGSVVLRTLENPSLHGREYLSLVEQAENRSTQMLIAATITALDPTFWRNPGFSFTGITQDVNHTIAERLVSDLLLWDEQPGIMRALRVRLLSAQIVAEFGRQKVIEWYLNSADYGKMIFGVANAGRYYFDKSVPEISLSEAAILAAIVDTPGLNPIDASDDVAAKKEAILEAMYATEMISEAEMIDALAELTVLRIDAETESSIDRSLLSESLEAFSDLVIEQVSNSIPIERLERGGFVIYSTLDFQLQEQIACTTELHIMRIRAAVQDSSIPNQSECPAASLLPTYTTDELDPLPQIYANALILDSTNGQILVMVGESDLGHNPAQYPGHPPGTLLTPFVYLTAFTRGFGPGTLVWDIPSNVPENLLHSIDSGWTFHGPIRIRTAMANDYLTPALQISHQLGAESLRLITSQLGLSSLEPSDADDFAHMILGKNETTLLEAAFAYATFSQSGVQKGVSWQTGPTSEGQAELHPSTVLRVEDHQGRLVLDKSIPETKAIIGSGLAYLLNHALSDESARWSSLGHPNPLEVGRPVSVKIGQTLDGFDLWTVGYSPYLVAATWLGVPDNPDAGPIPLEVGANLWHAVMQYASQDIPPDGWQAPQGVSAIEVCDPSGLLPTIYCPSIVSEIFLNGNEPTQADNLFKPFQINRETQRLATVFTPPELIDEEIFMVIPPQAIDWAVNAGLNIPPDEYDIVYTPSQVNPDVRITSPVMFDYVNGAFDIIGRATGEGFEFYRLLVGAGLNPQAWVQIGSDQMTPVEAGILGHWETDGLSGLYSIQLQVVRNDLRIETNTIQVTVDNHSPDVIVLSPQEGGRYPYPQTLQVTFQVQTNDDLGIAQVSFTVNDRHLTTLSQPPYAVTWNGRLGEHVLVVRAADLAGNIQEVRVNFSFVRE